jgi:hypothetical protein
MRWQPYVYAVTCGINFFAVVFMSGQVYEGLEAGSYSTVIVEGVLGYMNLRNIPSMVDLYKLWHAAYDLRDAAES